MCVKVSGKAIRGEFRVLVFPGPPASYFVAFTGPFRPSNEPLFYFNIRIGSQVYLVKVHPISYLFFRLVRYLFLCMQTFITWLKLKLFLKDSYLVCQK